MFNNFKIYQRLAIMFGIFIFILFSIGGLGLYFLKEEGKNVSKINTNIQVATNTQNLLLIIDNFLVKKAFEVEIGIDSWENGIDKLTLFDLEFKRLIKRLNQQSKEEYTEKLSGVGNPLLVVRKKLADLYHQKDKETLATFLKEDLDDMLVEPIQILETKVRRAKLAAENRLNISDKDAKNAFSIMTILFLLGLIVTGAFVFIISGSIVKPINQISSVVHAISNGDYTPRTKMQSTDEIGQLGMALDTLLEERLSDLAVTEQESESLNESVIGLLMTVSKLSERDLTAQALVTGDATGPVADALNLMTLETANVLTQVKKIASIVKQSSSQVDSQAKKVQKASYEQQQEITYTADNLSQASISLSTIAEVAKQANNLAYETAETTHNASKTVISTANSMVHIKETIQETGRRIKRLNERTQEISGIVNVINVIAKRTSVLALNASMQAAAAGEAGRGFAVVADEVQRLAESSRQATSQIEALIKNIIIEISGSMTTMDNTISQVIDGTKLAEQAGNAMNNTLSSTENLVASVAEISQSSEKQSSIAQELLERAKNIQERSKETSGELNTQLEQTKELASYAEKLLSSVAIFKLPKAS